MARVIEAIRAYSPRIKRGIAAELGDVVGFIAGRSSLNEGTILNVMAELREAITFHALSGRSVRLRGFNRDMIGKTTGDLVERWNREHPDDKVKKKE